MESQKDTNIVANVGGVLTHFNGIGEGGGALTRYDTTPIGGPPSADVDPDVREPLTYNVRTRVVGADQAARQAFLAKFVRGTTFDSKAAPVGSDDMKITGANQAASVGRRFTVMNVESSTEQAGNMELTITLEETGATPL